MQKGRKESEGFDISSKCKITQFDIIHFFN